MPPLAPPALPQSDRCRTPPPAALLRTLCRRGSRYDLMPAIYLAAHAGTCAGATPEANSEPAARPPFTVRPSSRQAFPPSSVRSVDWAPNSGFHALFSITAARMGLYGSGGALPPHYAKAVSSDDEPDTPLRAFLDLFHHRLYQLLFEGWLKRRPSLHPPGQAVPTPRTANRYRSLAGLPPAAEPQDSAASLRLAAFAGRLQALGRNAEGLRAILQSVLHVPVRIEENIPRRRLLPRPLVLRRGTARLGKTPPIGRTFLDRSGAFRIHLGPLHPDAYRALHPGGALARRVAEIVSSYVPDRLEYEVELTLKVDAADTVVLGRRDDRSDDSGDAGAPRLGHSTVLGQPPSRPARRLTYSGSPPPAQPSR